MKECKNEHKGVPVDTGAIKDFLTLSRTGGVFPSTARGGVNLTHTFLTASEGPTRHILCNII